MTNQDAINQALGLINVVESGLDANAIDSDDMLTALNQMLAQWAADWRDLQYPPQDTLTDTFPVVLWAQEAVIYNLAIRAAAMFQTPAVSHELIAKADHGLMVMDKVAIIRNMRPSSSAGLPRGSAGGGSCGSCGCSHVSTPVTEAVVSDEEGWQTFTSINPYPDFLTNHVGIRVAVAFGGNPGGSSILQLRNFTNFTGVILGGNPPVDGVLSISTYDYEPYYYRPNPDGQLVAASGVWLFAVDKYAQYSFQWRYAKYPGMSYGSGAPPGDTAFVSYTDGESTYPWIYIT